MNFLVNKQNMAPKELEIRSSTDDGSEASRCCRGWLKKQFDVPHHFCIRMKPGYKAHETTYIRIEASGTVSNWMLHIRWHNHPESISGHSGYQPSPRELISSNGDMQGYHTGLSMRSKCCTEIRTSLCGKLII